MPIDAKSKYFLYTILNYGGITSDVEMIETPETFIRDYWVQLAKGSRDQIDGWVQLDGDFRPQQLVSIEIPEAGIKISAISDGDGRAAFHVSAKLQLWSPGNPKLYEVRISSGNDAVRDLIGFRTIETRGSQILLNGEPIFCAAFFARRGSSSRWAGQ